MDLVDLKNMLEETQRSFPPHYPEKTHDVADQITRLISNLKKDVDCIGFFNANIAIKNIVGKMINEFLISAQYKSDEVFCDFEVTSQEIDNGKKIIVSYLDESLELEYLNDETITVTNNSKCPFIVYGEDYSNAIITYNTNKPNQLLLNQIFKNTSSCQSVMNFDDNGIEQKREIKVIPRTRTFQPINQCVIGSIERKDDFYTCCVKLRMIGDDFGNIVPQEEINMVNSISEITVPIIYIGSLEYDLNLLNAIILEDRSSGRNAGISELIYRYINSDECDDDYFKEEYKYSKAIIEYSNFLEFRFDSMNYSLPTIHAPYSFEILKNIKDYVHSQENTNNYNKNQ